MGIENLGSTAESGSMDQFHNVAHALVATFEDIDGFGDLLSPDASDKLAGLIGRLEEMPGQLHATNF